MSQQVNLFLSKFFPSKKEINNILNYSSSKINVLTWLFEMEYEERIKTFSLFNNELCHIMIKMYDKFNICNKLKFKINLKDKKQIINQREYSEDYFSLSDNYKFIQKLLLANLRFYKIQKTNDAVTLSEDILMNPPLFCEVFDKLSNNNFLNDLCPVILDQKQGVYTSTSPKWIEEKEYYNISQIIIGYFENILNIKYTLSKRKKNDINDAFKSFFTKKNIVLDLIKQSNHIESLFNMIDLKKIISDVTNDKIIINDEERRLASKKFLSGIYKPFKMFEPPAEYNQNKIFYKYKELLMEKSESMLNKLIFFPFEGENAIDRHIKERIFDELYSYAEKKNVENLLIEISEDGFLSKNNKKIRKKKKKNKKNDNENNKENNEDNKINNNKDNDNNIINNENIINHINTINTHESDEIREKDIKNKEDNNENNISTISNSSNNNNNNKEYINNINDNLENKTNNINNEINEEKNNDIISNNINISPEKKILNVNYNDYKNNNIIINRKENSDIKENNRINSENFEIINENNNINRINTMSDEGEKEEKKEDEKEIKIENNLYNNISNNKRKKKRKKKPKKKYNLSPQELNNIYLNFYNENNYFINGTQNKIPNSVSPIRISNKNPTKDKNEQLHNLILDFEKKTYKKLLSLHEIKYKSLVLLCQKIKDHFKCDLSVFIYGSYSTGLELEESDIDLSVELIPKKNSNNSDNIVRVDKNNNNLNQKTIPELINELYEYLSNFPEFKNLFPIVNTKIPILKMKIVLENNIETKIDLTFNLKNTTTTIKYYTNTLKRYPQIKPLTLLIKYLIKKNKLASVFDGGFSSHSIFIMIASNIRVLLKNKSSLNLGDLLNGFLHFYGKIFNYTNTIIDIMNKNNPYIINQELSKVPIFIDPITKVNVSKSSFLHEELKKLFSDTYDKLVQGENNLNKAFEDIFF